MRYLLIIIAIMGLSLQGEAMQEVSFNFNNRISTEISEKVDYEILKEFPILTKEVKRRSGTSVWTGILLQDVLNYFTVSEFQEMVISSADSYQVRLSQADITEETMLAYKRDDTNYEQMRLVIPGKRPMYWIANIATITVSDKNQSVTPLSFYFTEKILADKVLKEGEYYSFRELIIDYLPFLKGDFILISVDELEQNLDYDRYLSQAKLVAGDGAYHLQSPQMPAGMWLKDLEFIQHNDINIAFVFAQKKWKDFLSRYHIAGSIEVFYQDGKSQTTDATKLDGLIPKEVVGVKIR